MRSPGKRGSYHRSKASHSDHDSSDEQKVEFPEELRFDTQESKMDPKARLSSLCAKWFYFCTHVVYFLGLFVMPNQMRDSLLAQGNPWFIIFAVLFVAALLLYIATWSNPGFLDQHPYFQQSENDPQSPQKLRRKFAQKPGGLSVIREATNETAKDTSVIDYAAFKGSDHPEAIQEEAVEETLETAGQEEETKRKKTGNVWDKIQYFRPSKKEVKIPEMHYCDVCQLTQPYRTKHCHSCGRCVRKYDHHCFWLGTCVGELNHGKFWIFLAVEFAVLLQALCNVSIASSQRLYSSYDSASFAYSFFGTFQVIVVCCLIFVGVLLVQHTLLISVNMTSWEIMRRHSIDYLQIYPSGFKPFNRGFCQNWRSVLGASQCQEWELPNPNSLNLKFNCCENKWWSCF